MEEFMATKRITAASAAGQNKKKASAQQNATKKIAERDHSGSRPVVPRSAKAISQGRFPGETPLTGEDRPSGASGGKQQGYEQSVARDEVPPNVGHAARPSPLRPGGQQRMAGNQR